MLYVTAQDLQDTLARMLGGDVNPEEVLDIRKAIREALRYVSASYNWPYYHSFYHLTTDEPYEEGEIAYDASEGTVTLTDGTFPDWVGSGVLIMDSTLHVRVDTVVSDTEVTVLADDAPPDDYTGTYTLYRYQYEMPADLNIYKFGKLQMDQTRILEYSPPELFETDIRLPNLTVGDYARWFTVSRSKVIGRTSLSIWPYPTTAARLRFGYLRHPRDIRTWLEKEGTVSTGADSASIVGTETRFSANHVNCLLRTSSDRINLPSSRDGRNPPVDEVVIESRESLTQMTAADDLENTANEVAYTLSDILDYDTATMHEVITYAAMKQLGRLRGKDPKMQAVYEASFKEHLYLAKCQSSGADTVSLAARAGGRHETWPGLFDAYYTLG